MHQANDLQQLIELLRAISEDILVYTGYSLDEISADQLNGIAVLIDGEYIESRNNNCILRGSDNQLVHILDDRFREIYNDYLSSAANQIQNFMTSDGVISVGIHKPNFLTDLNNGMIKKGVEK